MSKEFTSLLECPICFDFFNTCMVTSCSHNYCSLCIRKYLTYKSQCPLCFEETSEPELRNNRLVDNIVKFYLERRRKDEGVLSSEIDATQQNLESQCKRTFEEQIENHQVVPEDNVEKVTCPVCNLLIKVSSVNIHLDMCLNRDERKESLRGGSSVSKRKKLPKVVYHLLPDKELKKILADAGLKDEGDRQVLVKRHKSYLVLYNSECDSLNPRPVSEIVKQIHDDEEMEESLSKENVKVIELDKKMDPDLIERKQQAYLKTHQSQFSRLVEDIQQRDCKRSKTGIIRRRSTSKKTTFMDGPCTSKFDGNNQGISTNDNDCNNKLNAMDDEKEGDLSKAETGEPSDNSLNSTSDVPEQNDSTSKKIIVEASEEAAQPNTVSGVVHTSSESDSETASKDTKVSKTVKNKLSRKIAKGPEQADGFTPVKRTRHPSDEF